MVAETSFCLRVDEMRYRKNLTASDTNILRIVIESYATMLDTS